MYLAFQILDYALLSAPGAPLKKALTDAGIGKDIMGSYDNGIYQPIFSIVSKNANQEQKKAFIQVIEDVLRECADKGIDQKALEAGINYHEFRYRERILEIIQKDLCMDSKSWIAGFMMKTSRLSILRR